MPGLAVDRRGERAHFAVKLTPRAARTRLGPVRDGVLLARVTAVPVDGAANASLRELLADALRLAPSLVRIESGATSPRKRVSVPAQLAERLRAL